MRTVVLKDGHRFLTHIENPKPMAAEDPEEVAAKEPEEGQGVFRLSFSVKIQGPMIYVVMIDCSSFVLCNCDFCILQMLHQMQQQQKKLASL